ncbi:MKRN2 opposite strand protein-like [Styela clava]
MEEELIVIKHCATIVCKSSPDVCFACLEPIDYGATPPPTFYDCPITNGHRNIFSIIVKPTDDTWDSACKSDCDLHIGITDGSGKVASYDWHGIARESKGWEGSLVIYQVQTSDVFQLEYIWKNVIDKLENDGNWSAYEYDEDQHNCFDYVLAFLDKVEQEYKVRYESSLPLGLVRMEDRSETRRKFIEDFILPKMQEAVEYTRILNEVRNHSYAII